MQNMPQSLYPQNFTVMVIPVKRECEAEKLIYFCKSKFFPKGETSK